MARTTWSLVLLGALAVTAGTGCNAISDAVSVDAQRLLQLSTSSTTAPADGASLVTVTATIPETSEPDNRRVTFTTTAGTIVGAPASDPRQIEVHSNLAGHAIIHIQAPTQVGAATVTAEIDGLAQNFVLTFGRALPTRIDVDPQESELNVLTGDDVALVIFLRRDPPGVATEGTPVELTALDNRGRPIGSFVAVTPSDATGKATALFQVGADASYRGPVTIFARVRDPLTGAVVEGSTVISLID